MLVIIQIIVVIHFIIVVIVTIVTIVIVTIVASDGVVGRMWGRIIVAMVKAGIRCM